MVRSDGEQIKAVPIRQRSAARLSAIQIIYQSLITGQSLAEIVPQFMSFYVGEVSKSFKIRGIDKKHLQDLHVGIGSGHENLDQMISEALSTDWSIDRLPRIELAVLRCGAHELATMPHIPARAVISEYAALGDVCGCEVSFVNAILDTLARTLRFSEMGA